MRCLSIIQRFIITPLTLCLAIGAAPLMATAGDFSGTFTHDGVSVSSSAIAGNFETLIGGGCFISASASELAGIGVIFGLCLAGLLIGLRLIINDPAGKEALEEVK